MHWFLLNYISYFTLRSRLMLFRQQTGTRKTLLLTFITAYGLTDNEYKQQLADNEVGMDGLFR